MAEQWVITVEILKRFVAVGTNYGSEVFHMVDEDQKGWCRGQLLDEVITLEKALKRGLRPCKICVPDAYEKPWKWDPTAPRIEDVAERLFADVPEEEWAKLPDGFLPMCPNDLLDNLDHYIYGTPKKGD